MREKVKIVYKDGNVSKLLFGFLCKEDGPFYTIEADRTGTVFRVNKNAVVTLKFLENNLGGDGNGR